MASMHQLNPAETTGPLSEESKGLPFGESIRDYELGVDTKWRFGKPSYARVNKAYFKNRVKVHKEGSLEAMVSKMVKNWEVESHHVGEISQWKTMDTTIFRAARNGGQPANAQLICDTGHYNMLLGDTPEYISSKQNFESANLFRNAFPGGFAWECLEVLSGPPNVTFKWRHFGEYTGVYIDREGRKHQGDGKVINVIGMCIAKVNQDFMIEGLDVYYNVNDLMKPLVTNLPLVGSDVAIVGDRELLSPAAPLLNACKPDNCAVM